MRIDRRRKTANGAVFVVSALLFIPSDVRAEEKMDARPYLKAGIVNCALPGTTIEFGLDGAGRATVTRASSNYTPFLKAAKVKSWSASMTDKDGLKILILDNGKKTRIMIKIPDGNGMAFTVPEGVSDILCQVLVQPD